MFVKLVVSKTWLNSSLITKPFNYHLTLKQRMNPTAKPFIYHYHLILKRQMRFKLLENKKAASASVVVGQEIHLILKRRMRFKLLENTKVASASVVVGQEIQDVMKYL